MCSLCLTGEVRTGRWCKGVAHVASSMHWVRGFQQSSPPVARWVTHSCALWLDIVIIGEFTELCIDCGSDHVFSNTCRPPRALQTFLNLLSTQPSISTFGLDCWSLNRLDLNWDTLGNNSFNNICTIWMSALENTCRQHILREVLTSQLEQMQSDLRSTQIKMSGIPYKGVYLLPMSS